MALFHSVTFPLSCRDALRQYVLSYIQAHSTVTSSPNNTSKVHDHWTTMYNAKFIISAPF